MNLCTPDKHLPITISTKPGQLLRTESGHSIQLGSMLGEGDEGAVYKTNTSFVAKIYKPEKNSVHKYEKIKRLLNKKLNKAGICAPVALLYNSRNEFVGYLMPMAFGEKLRSLYVKPILQKRHPNWTKMDINMLCITILEKIQYLHSMGIILGDINPDNILFVSPQEVYFVDCDSYQIDGYPCPVGTIPFTAPELQNRGHYSSYLRTLGNENFAVAVLLFSLMLPGQMPYNQKGGESAKDKIIQMDFSYALGKNSNKKTPDGPWRFMWSHMPYMMKDAFYNTFNKGGKFSKEQTRISVQEWLKKFNEYLRLLRGDFGKKDPMSNMIYPTRFKKQDGVVYVKCSRCGNETKQEFLSDRGICVECRRKEGIVKSRRYHHNSPSPNRVNSGTNLWTTLFRII